MHSGAGSVCCSAKVQRAAEQTARDSGLVVVPCPRHVELHAVACWVGIRARLSWVRSTPQWQSWFPRTPPPISPAPLLRGRPRPRHVPWQCLQLLPPQLQSSLLLSDTSTSHIVTDKGGRVGRISLAVLYSNGFAQGCFTLCGVNPKPVPPRCRPQCARRSADRI
jgi:hypothetical protein